MPFPLARQQTPDLRLVPRTGSTNSDLLVAATDEATPDFTTIATFDQTTGRGRLDRSWVAPPGSALAVSVLLRGVVAGPHASWIPLLAGVAMTQALGEVWPGRFGLKWPNDVLLGDRKVCGILVETARGRDAVVGAGLNLRQSDEELPVPTAISLVGAGLAVDDDTVDAVLAGYLARLRRLLVGQRDAGELRELVSRHCVTIGRRVRVRLPSGPDLDGRAVGVDPTGRLQVRRDDGATVALAVGDVIHVRAV